MPAILHLLRAIVIEHAIDIFLPVIGMLFQEIPVDYIVVVFQQDVGDGVQKADVAVEDRNMDGIIRIDILVAHYRAGTARVDDHRRDVLLFFVIGRAPEDDRMRFAGVVSEMHDHVAQLDILIGQRWRIRAQRGEISGNRRGHAHAGIGFDRVGAENPLHEEILKILPLHGELPGTIQADGIAAICLGEMGDLVIDHFRGVLVRHPNEMFLVERALGLTDEIHIAVIWLVPFRPDILAHICIAFHPVDIHGLCGGQALDALQAVIRRMVLVGPHRDDLAVFHLDDRAAADPAIGALRDGGGSAFLAFLRQRLRGDKFGIGSDHKSGACGGRRNEGAGLHEAAPRKPVFHAFH
jgi:hypothetical protein